VIVKVKCVSSWLYLLSYKRALLEKKINSGTERDVFSVWMSKSVAEVRSDRVLYDTTRTGRTYEVLKHTYPLPYDYLFYAFLL
jgi:hypothetical protein